MKVKASYKPILHSPYASKDPTVFSSIDNHQFIKQRQTQPIDYSKENVNSHTFVPSPLTDDIIPFVPPSTTHHKLTRTKPQTSNTKAELSSRRPTMGGKTIGAIQQSSTTMSSEELKLLSRRIDPHQPLASPHASPTKPPLPPLTLVEKKRKRRKKEKSNRLLECAPCHKVYKTRAGLTYHLEKCAYRRKQQIITVHCICNTPLTSDGTMIECVQCHTWLHTRCVSGVAQENEYCCPRCDTTNHTTQNETEPVNESEGELAEDEEEEEEEDGRMISLSALYSVEERGKNSSESFKQVQEREAQELNTNYFDTINLISETPHHIEEDDPEEDFQSLSLPPSSIFEDQDFTQFDWCQPEEVPSLLFSSDNTTSYLDEVAFSSTETQGQEQADWFHFANFESDFNSDI